MTDPRTVDWNEATRTFRGVERMRSLQAQLDAMSIGSFSHHGTQGHNSFWIRRDDATDAAEYAMGVDLARGRDVSVFRFFPKPVKRPFLWLPNPRTR